MQSLQNDGKDENDERDDDDNDHHHHNQLTKIAPFIGKVLILSEAGKPIYYSEGIEEEICGIFGVISIIVQRYHHMVHGSESGKDSLLSIQTPNQYFQFLYRSPLILALISDQPWNLPIQLDTIYNQIISMFSRQFLRQIYEKRGHNYDIRNLFDGIDKRVEACMKGFNEDPVILYGLSNIAAQPNGPGLSCPDDGQHYQRALPKYCRLRPPDSPSSTGGPCEEKEARLGCARL